MTTHELAKLLLAGPDRPVQLQVNTNEDGYWGAPGDVQILTDEQVAGDVPRIVLFAYQEAESDQD